MSFWDKVKEFVGLDEDYIDDDFYDDYDRDYDSYEGDSTLTTDHLTSDSEEKELTFETAIKEDNRLDSRKEERSGRKSQELTSYRSTQGKMKVAIREPINYEQGNEVLDDIMEGKTVVLNLEMLEPEIKTQIFYFVSGGLYSLKGTLQNVTKDIYVLAPDGTTIDGELKKNLSDKSLYQL